MTLDPLEFLGIPATCRVDRVLYKKMFQDHGYLNAADKRALSEDVARIRWRYSLKPETLNVSAYADEVRTYGEIAILTLELSNAKRLARLADLAHRSIPYPLVLVFEHAGRLAISTAPKRHSQADKSRWVMEDRWISPWIDQDDPKGHHAQLLTALKLAALPSSNFYALYLGITAQIIAAIAAERTGAFTPASQIDAERLAQTLKQIRQLKQEIAEMRGRLKRQTQMAGKVRLNSALKSHKDAIIRLETHLTLNPKV